MATMAQLQFVVTCAFVLFLCVQQGHSLSCYVCNSHNDTACSADLPPDSFKKECYNETYILCRKIKQVVDFEINGLQPETRIIRSCGYVDASSTNVCYSRSVFGGRQEVCACNKDNCNSSSALSAPAALVALLALLKLRH